MKQSLRALFLVFLFLPIHLIAQGMGVALRPGASTPTLNAALRASRTQTSSATASAPGSTSRATSISKPREKLKPLSRMALGVGVGPLVGINMQLATNLCQHANLRLSGNVFSYQVTRISTNGVDLTPDLNLASAGVSLDLYPFAYHGFRLSPGVLVYNTNQASTNILATGGSSFTLNDQTYYSSLTNPVTGKGIAAFHTQRPAFTMTTGWGNMIPRKGGHWSFPFELGVALVGAPTINMALTGGEICDSTYTLCMPVVGNADLNTNLQAQVAKYKNDLEPLKTYPIITFGVSYSFKIR